MRSLRLSLSLFLLKSYSSPTRFFSRNIHQYLSHKPTPLTSYGPVSIFSSSNFPIASSRYNSSASFSISANSTYSASHFKLHSPITLGEAHTSACNFLISTGTEESEAEAMVRLLFSHFLNLPPSYNFYYEDLTQSSVLPPSILTKLSNFLIRLSEAGEAYPLQYILGEWNFGGLTLGCKEPILIPRPETEELAYRVIERLSTISVEDDESTEEKNEKFYKKIWLLSLLRNKNDYNTELFEQKEFNFLNNTSWKYKVKVKKPPSVKEIKSYIDILSKPTNSYWIPNKKREVKYSMKVFDALRYYEELEMKSKRTNNLEQDVGKSNKFIKVLDIGSGTGALGLLIAYNLPHVQVDSIDINLDAVELSNSNAKRIFKNPERFYSSYPFSLEQFLKNNKKKYDLIISNPPYIPSKAIEDLQKQVKKYEDIRALSGGSDGLNLIHDILNCAHDLLSEDGLREIWLEVDESHPSLLHDLLPKYTGFDKEEEKSKEVQFIESFNDSYGLPRFIRLFANNINSK